MDMVAEFEKSEWVAKEQDVFQSPLYRSRAIIWGKQAELEYSRVHTSCGEVDSNTLLGFHKILYHGPGL